MNAQAILQIIALLEQYGTVTISAVEAVITAIKSAMGITDDTMAVADLQQLIADCITQKAEADAAASGQDPQ